MAPHDSAPNSGYRPRTMLHARPHPIRMTLLAHVLVLAMGLAGASAAHARSGGSGGGFSHSSSSLHSSGSSHHSSADDQRQR